MTSKQHLLPPNFFRTLLTIALPIILQNLMQSLVNMLDTIMVGQLGVDAGSPDGGPLYGLPLETVQGLNQAPHQKQ